MEKGDSTEEQTNAGLNKLQVFAGKLLFGAFNIAITLDDTHDDPVYATIITGVVGVASLYSAYTDYKDLNSESPHL